MPFFFAILSNRRVLIPIVAAASSLVKGVEAHADLRPSLLEQGQQLTFKFLKVIVEFLYGHEVIAGIPFFPRIHVAGGPVSAANMGNIFWERASLADKVPTMFMFL